MKKLLRALRFLRITDDSDNLSLTNICLVAVLVQMTGRPELAVTDVAGLLATIVGYQFKRYLQPAAATPADELADLKSAIGTIETKLTGLQMGQNLRKR